MSVATLHRSVWYRHTHLEESLQPPDLEDTLTNEHGKLENAPPLHSGVCALRCVPMYPLSNDNVRLFILHLSQSLGEFTHCKEAVS